MDQKETKCSTCSRWYTCPYDRLPTITKNNGRGFERAYDCDSYVKGSAEIRVPRKPLLVCPGCGSSNIVSILNGSRFECKHCGKLFS